jgi:hypothetical protein
VWLPDASKPLSTLAESETIMVEELSPEELQNLIDTYGPSAQHSEHRRGQHIRYILDRDRTATGIISWVCCARDLPGGKSIGITYVVFPDVAADDPDERFVDIVFPSDVLG